MTNIYVHLFDDIYIICGFGFESVRVDAVFNVVVECEKNKQNEIHRNNL